MLEISWIATWPTREHPKNQQMLTIVQAETPEQVATARELMKEYAAELAVDLCFQNFDQEMQALPGQYAPPSGRILLAYSRGQAAGVIALRPVGDAGACEMKRLFVRSGFRGESLGRALVEKLIAEAASIGYSRMRLDTIQGKMDQAIALYRALGFREIPAYYATPVRETLFMELELARRNH
jgi:GNAT superfamily N-acetyltransferase